MKKICAVILAVLMAVSIAGCGNKSESESKKKDGIIQIEFWYGLGGELGKTMESVIKAFNESQDRIEVVGVQQSSYDETKKMIQAAVASGSVPATALLNIETIAQFDGRGVMQPLDEYIEADEDFNKEEFFDTLMEYCIDSEGQTVGLPVYGTTQVMYYRKDVFEKAGIDPDEAFKNWQSLAEAAKKLTVVENGETVFYGWEPMYDENNLKDMAFANGGEVLSEDGTKVTINTPEWVETWECMRKWIHEDEIMRIHFGGDGWEYWYKTIDDVMQDRAAGYTGSSGDQGDLDFTKIGAHIQPGFNDNGPNPFADTLTCAVLAKASEEEKQAGYEWLSYLTSAESSAAISMKTGYIPVRESVLENEEFKKHLEEHPEAMVPIEQMKVSRMNFIDPTGGKIVQALADAADLVEIENVPAQEALDHAQEVAQQALDEYLSNQ